MSDRVWSISGGRPEFPFRPGGNGTRSPSPKRTTPFDFGGLDVSVAFGRNGQPFVVQGDGKARIPGTGGGEPVPTFPEGASTGPMDYDKRQVAWQGRVGEGAPAARTAPDRLVAARRVRS